MSAARCALPLSWATRAAAALCLVFLGLVVGVAAAAAEPTPLREIADELGEDLMAELDGIVG